MQPTTIVYAMMLVRASLDLPLSSFTINLGPISTTPGIFMNLAMIAMMASCFIGRKKVVYPKIIAHAWMPFLIWAAFEMFRSPSILGAAKVLFNYCTYMAAFFWGYKISRRIDGPILTSKVLAYSALIPIAITPLQLFVFPYAGSARASSTFTHPNTFAFFLVISLSYLYFIMIYSNFRAGLNRKLAGVMFIAGIACLAMTQTRSAMLAMCLYLVVVTVSLRPKWLPAMLLFGAFVFALPPVHDRFIEVFSGTSENIDVYTAAAIADGQISGTFALDSYQWRKLIWNSAWKWIVESPLLGYGLESFGPLSPLFFPLSNGGDAAHNIYVQMTFELGFVGAMLYLILIVSTIFHYLRMLTTHKAQSVLLLSVILSYSFCSYSDNMLYYLSVNWYFWFFIGAFLIPRASLRTLSRKPSILKRRFPTVNTGGLCSDELANQSVDPR